MSRLVVWASAALIFVGSAQAFRSLAPPPGLNARYFNNLTRSGPPIASGIGEPSTASLSQGPGATLAAFSADWSGYLTVLTSGVYSFTTVSDDGSELEVADQLVVRNGGVHGIAEASGQLELRRGVYPVHLRYLQAGGQWALAVEWTPPGAARQPIPLELLSPGPRSLAAYYGWRAGPYVLSGLLVWALHLVRRNRLGRVAGAPPLASTRWYQAAVAPRYATWILVGTGAAARVFVALGSQAVVWPDSYVFYLTAQSILQGRLTEHDPFRTFLYPVFLSAFLWFGETPVHGMLAVAAQQALGLLTVVLFYRVLLKVLTRGQALAAALLYSVHSLQLFYEVSVLSETLFTFVLAACLWVLTRFLARPTAAWAAVAGAMLAGLTLVRPVAQWYVVVGVGLALITPARGWRKRAGDAVLIGACYLAVLVPWMAVNQAQYGFWGISIGRGLGLYTRVFDIDQAPLPAATRYAAVERLTRQARAGAGGANYVRDQLNYGLRYSTYQADEAMFGYAREAVLEHPLRFAAHSARQWLIQLTQPLEGARTCASPEGPYLCSGRVAHSDLPAFPGLPPDRRIVRAAVAAYVAAASPGPSVVFWLAVLGGLAWLVEDRRPRTVGALLVATVAYFTLVPALSQWPQDRYRLPVDALLFAFAVAGVAAMVTVWRGRGATHRSP